jgi:hypothetical protein
MNKLFKLLLVAIVISLLSVGYAFMMGFSWGTPAFGECVSSSFGTGIVIVILATIFFDINFDN